MKTLIIISLIISIFLTSSIMISVDEFKIKNLNCLKQIIKCLINENIEDIPDCFNIIVYIKIYILKIIPIKIIKIDNKFIKKRILKNKKKKMKKMQKERKRRTVKKENNIIDFMRYNEENNKENEQKNWKSQLKLKSNLKLNDITINELKINLNIDMKSSYNSAMVTSIGNILLSYFYTFLFKKCNMKNYQTCKYMISTSFKNKNDFYLRIKFKISINILTILSKIKMYKIKLSVNNTNKFKLKERI